MQNDYNSKKELSSIEEIFSGEFPTNYVNNVKHYGNYTTEELHKKNKSGIYELLHMDIDLGNTCSLQCPHCFRRDSRVDSEGEEGFLNDIELLSYIQEAKELGLKSVKFLGRGEPFENRKFLGFLEKLTELGIGSSVFTKGHVIGDDVLAKKFNKHYGINSGQELAERLQELDVSILLGFNSFDKKMQDAYVGIDKSSIKKYTELRDSALKKLVQSGLNKYVEGEATRLALVAAPIKPENIQEIKEIYSFGRRRNMYVISCPSNESGLGLDEIKRVSQFKNYKSELIELYKDIYIWNIKNKLQTLDQFKEEGVSLYPGNRACNQVASGFYLALSGKVFRCPGRTDKQSTFSENVRAEKSLETVWMRSENYKRAIGKIKSPEKNDFNYRCPARDGLSLTADFYKDIKNKVLNHFKSK